MKLYATVTSERATKGQGGNEYIECKVLNADRTTKLLHFYIKPEGDNLRIRLSVQGERAQEYCIKGEKQEGE